ncbi:MAG: ABC transporter transmembrane domain-containing protein [Hyphomicrobiales bacterium]
MSSDESKTPSAENVDGDAMKHKAEGAGEDQVTDAQVTEADADENADENQTVVKPLSDLTTEDFQKLGLPVGGHDGLSDYVPENDIEASINNIEQAFSPLLQSKEKDRSNAYDRCLRSLLVELKWPGEDRHIIQALPHFKDMDDILSFQGVLHHLGFESRVSVENAANLEKRLPCLVIDDEARPRIGLRFLPNGKLLVYDGPRGDLREMDKPTGQIRICLVEQTGEGGSVPQNRKISWFYEGLRKFNSKIILVVSLTFVANLLALSTPVFTMNVYNRVIGSKSLDTLVFFVSAILVTLMFEIYIRHIRGRLIAYVGARFNTQLLIRAFERILNLPISMTESASVSQQIVRLRQFENVQSFFTGPLVSAGLDLPFTIVFILAISLIHPILALIPVGLAVVFVLIGLVSMPMTKRNVLITGKFRQTHQNLLIETVNKRDTIRQLRAEDVWIKRWDDIGQEFNSRRFNAQFFDTIMHTLAQSLVMIAGIATLWAGALLVIAEELSVGGLIAVMMFVWRILSPIQTAFLSLNRIGQFGETARQADLLMGLVPERDPSTAPTLRRNYEGRITFDGVSFKYGAAADPVFRGVSVDIPAGQAIAITGDPASGKSSFLKMILGLYKPQGGTVFLDGLNLQQLNVDEVRTSIGYVAQRPEFFYGTLAQNIRLANPSATDGDLEEALSAAGIWLPHTQLEDGIDTRLTASKLGSMSNTMKQCFSIARAFVKDENIYLLDSPSSNLNMFEREALFDKIGDLKGKSTLVIATTDDELISKCDRVLYLRAGAIAYDDTSEKFLAAKAAAAQKKAG